VTEVTQAIYGCIQSAMLWYEELCRLLTALGFVRNPDDWCAFNRDFDGVQCTVIFHVDDLNISCVLEGPIDCVISALRQKFRAISVHRVAVHSYLGMTFDYRTRGQVKVTMQGYVDSILDMYDVQGAATSPATEHLFDINDSSPRLDRELSVEFHTIVAKLLFLVRKVRPNMMPPIAFLTTRVQALTEEDWSKLQRVLKYLNGSKTLGIILRPDIDMTLNGYFDASYSGHADAKSHSGSVITLGKGPVHAKSSKQKIVSKSSTEAKLICASDSASQLLWVRSFLLHQGHDMKAAKVHQDDKSTITMLGKGRSTQERTRHIQTRYYFIKDRVGNGELQLVYTPTESMVADILTKPLQGELFRRLRRELLNWDTA
jgi:hypothetical protein